MGRGIADRATTPLSPAVSVEKTDSVQWLNRAQVYENPIAPAMISQSNTRPSFPDRAMLFDALATRGDAAWRVDDFADPGECVPRQLNRDARRIDIAIEFAVLVKAFSATIRLSVEKLSPSAP